MMLNKQTLSSVVCVTKGGVPEGSGVILSLDGYSFLCTCKHVVDLHPDGLVLNSKQKEKTQIHLDLSGLKCHDKADIALCPIKKHMLDSDPEVRSVPLSYMLPYGSEEFANLGLGDTVFTLGFPMGIDGKKTSHPILRGGFIARLDDECIKDGYSFWIDSHLFPGNSSGPVFLKPESVSLTENPAIGKGYLLGIVSKGINVIRNESCENFGLSMIVPIHYAIEIYEKYFAEVFRIARGESTASK